MFEFAPSPPSQEQIELSIIRQDGTGITLTQFTEYEFASAFETPCDGWYFTIGGAHVNDELDFILKSGRLCGCAVKLRINGAIQSTGYVDAVEVSSSRQGGTAWHISGRDVLAQAVDSCADPTKTLKEGATLEGALIEIFTPFGWDTADKFIVDDAANLDVMLGNVRGTPMTKGGKKKGPKPLKSFVLHQTRPYSREGVLQFASRLAERHGLFVWATADGEKLVVGRPDFTRDPVQSLIRKQDKTNVLDGSIKFDVSEQPTVIVVDGSGGGGEFGRSRIKSIMCNTAVCTSDPAFLEPYKRYPDAKRVMGYEFATPVSVPRNRTWFLKDSEAQNQEQLDNYARREMAIKQRKTLAANYTVEGHGQIVNGTFTPWVINTTVRVDDDIAGLHEVMYVAERTFRKSRSGGTTTHLGLVRLNTITLGEPDEPAEEGKLGAPKLQVERIKDPNSANAVPQFTTIDMAPRKKK